MNHKPFQWGLFLGKCFQGCPVNLLFFVYEAYIQTLRCAFLTDRLHQIQRIQENSKIPRLQPESCDISLGSKNLKDHICICFWPPTLFGSLPDDISLVRRRKLYISLAFTSSVICLPFLSKKIYLPQQQQGTEGRKGILALRDSHNKLAFLETEEQLGKAPPPSRLSNLLMPNTIHNVLLVHS